MVEKIIKGVIIFVFASLVAFFMIVPWYKADELFLNVNYNYVVRDIEFRAGNRGVPTIKTDTATFLLKIDEMKIIPYLSIGDSVVKLTQSRKIIVFRKDGLGNLNGREFN